MIFVLQQHTMQQDDVSIPSWIHEVVFHVGNLKPSCVNQPSHYMYQMHIPNCITPRYVSWLKFIRQHSKENRGSCNSIDKHRVTASWGLIPVPNHHSKILFINDSFPSSHSIVKGDVWHEVTTSALNVGARAYLTMAVVFVLPQANPWAILLSGSIFYTI